MTVCEPIHVGEGAGAHAKLAFHWYALRVRSNTEFQVSLALQRVLIETFLPTWSEDVQWSDRKKTTVRPLFPGYVFARLLNDACDVRLALQTRGVVQLLPSSFSPQAIPDAEIEMVRRVVAVTSQCRPCAFVSGDLVTIDSGPLAGVSGVVVRTRGSLRVVVSVEILQRAVSVELDAGTLLKQKETDVPG